MKKPLFHTVAVVGVGLIGGSIGLAVKKRGLAKIVVGVARRKKSIAEIFDKKAADVVTLDWKEGVAQADLVILCAPVPVIADQLRTISSHIKKGALVIDVGSSKSLIEKEARKHLKNRFVGCHPMAGSEAKGVSHASENLFENSVCFVAKKDARILNFWKALGASTIVMDAESHDRWVASASHLPHLLAFSLFQDFKVSPKIPLNPSLQGLARIAKSDPGLWADIFLSNEKNVSAASQKIRKSLTVFENAFRTRNRAAILRLVRHANQKTR